MNIGSKEFFGLPRYFFYMLIVALIIWFVFEHTPLGRFMFATGGNPEAARLAGVRTNWIVWGSLVASGLIAGLAGAVYSWKVGNYATSVGPGYLFPAVAAVFFGASQLKGRPNVWGTLIALYALAFGIKGLQLTFSSNTIWIEPLFQGVSLLAAVSLASYRGVVRVPRRTSSQAPTTPSGDARDSVRTRDRATRSARRRAAGPERRHDQRRGLAWIAPSSARSSAPIPLSRRRPPAASRCSAPSRRGTTRSARR